MTAPDTMGRVVPYNPAKHEGFVLESWVRTWARARAGVRMGVDQDGPRWRAFWEQYRPLALTLLQTEHVSVMEDTETPGVIWGWMARSHDGEVVHDVVIKRDLTKRGDDELNAEARDMVTQLVGDLMEKRIGHTGELAAMRVLGMWPKNWHYDTTYIARKLVDIIRQGKAAA